MDRAKTITIHSAKGGVGKTTSSLTISYILTLFGYKVLLVDLDPHTASTNHLMSLLTTTNRDYTIRQLLLGDLRLSEVIVSPYENLDFIPSQLRLQNIEKELADENNPLFILYNLIEEIEQDYDYIVFDTPGNVGFMTKSAMLVSDYILIPSQLEAWPIEAIEISFDNINKIKSSQKYINRNIEKVSILPTFYEERRQLSTAFHNSLTHGYKNYLSKNVIHRSVDIAKTYSTPGANIDLNTRSFSEYQNVVNELLGV